MPGHRLGCPWLNDHMESVFQLRGPVSGFYNYCTCSSYQTKVFGRNDCKCRSLLIPIRVLNRILIMVSCGSIYKVISVSMYYIDRKVLAK